MTNEETIKRIRALAGEIIAMTDRLIDQPQAEEAAPIAPKYSLEYVRAALTKLAGAKGADAAKAVLTAFDAKKLSDIAPADYARVVAEAEKQL